MDSDKVVQPDIAVICNSDIIQEKGCFWGSRLDHWNHITTHRQKDIQDKFDLYEEVGVKNIGYWTLQ